MGLKRAERECKGWCALARKISETIETVESLRQELRDEFFPLALLPYPVLGAIMGLLDQGSAEPPSLAAYGMLLWAFAFAVWKLYERNYELAAWALSLGGVALVMLGWFWFPTAEMYHAFILPIVTALAVLGVWQGALVAGIASLLLFLGFYIFPWQLGRTWAFLSDLFLLWSVVYVVSLARRSEGTLISWAWQGYRQARDNLEMARDRQVELKQALEDLALVTRETVRLNEMLSAARKAVEEARKAKEEFVANVSHELRTPLNMIIGFSDMILKAPEVYARRLPAALLADIAAIRRNSQHLASLVDDVLDLSEADTGRMRLLKEWTPLGDVIREAAEAVAALFQKKGLALKVNIPEDLPPVYCDCTRIRQVVLNLLSNAGRFTQEGEVRIDVQVRGQWVQVDVVDTGPGMEPSKLERLFEPFSQADLSIRRQYGGTGLGLAISKRLVELHGGKIWLESQLGVGTSVHFTLPLASDLDQGVVRTWVNPYQDYAPRLRRSAAPQVKPSPCIVVLEKGEAASELLARYLDGVEIIRVERPQEAKVAIEEKAAMALLINEAPQMETDSILAELASLAFDVPIFSCWIPERQAAFEELGAQDYLVKPVTREQLLESIKRIAPQARTLLLVDDDPEARQLFRRMLVGEEGGYIVLQCEDGQTTLRLLRERKPDLLLLDLVMPNMDGFAVLEAKTKDEEIRDIPVIIISARDPQRAPIISKELILTRQQGLSAHDLVSALEAVLGVLKPRFGAPASPEGLRV
ncbi:MAG: response regulator [Anaerolineae bacterium]|nr:response regulator [Anaerolineae bacterium]